MLSKAHLTSHSRMSGSRSVITPPWLSELWRSFLYSSSVYSCHLFLISSASVLYYTHFCMNCCSLGISNFPEEISSLFYSIFLYFFALITEEGFISPCYSLELCIQMGIPFLFSFTFSFSSFLSYLLGTLRQPFCPFAFLFLGDGLTTASCTMLQTSVHSSSGTLSDLIPWNYLSHPLYNCKGFDLGHTWMVSGFPYFLQFKSEFCNKEFMIWATVSFWSCFCWLYRVSPSSAAKNIISLILVWTIWWCPCVESSLVLLEDGICYNQCILLAKLC